MSRGLGAIQRQIIEIGGATKILQDFDLKPSIRIAHDEPGEVNGEKLKLLDDRVFRSDNKPYFHGYIESSSVENYLELKKRFRSVEFFKGYEEGGVNYAADSLWSLNTILATLAPELFTVNHQRFGFDKRKRMHLTIDPAIKKQKAVIKSSVSRAINSFQSKGLLIWFGYAWLNKIKETAERRGWKVRYSESKYGDGGYVGTCDTFYAVVDSKLLVGERNLKEA